jgi:hypothetical protein
MMVGREIDDDLAQPGNIPQDVQKGCRRGRSERRAEAYPLGYVEGVSDARTKPAASFNILLKRRMP